MRIDPSPSPDHGASPRSIMEHGLDVGRAQQVLKAVNIARGAIRTAARIAAKEASDHGLWFGGQSSETGDAIRATALETILIEAFEEQLNASLIEEAGEMA